MTAYGTTPTYRDVCHLAAFGGEADISQPLPNNHLLGLRLVIDAYALLRIYYEFNVSRQASLHSLPMVMAFRVPKVIERGCHSNCPVSIATPTSLYKARWKAQ
jgi:hypothetical protein